ncbi:cytochrome P450 2 sub U member 1 [Bulinus truncatus]|nr:cytochrome P450 2 sub U member 1 [Bulinus truncatus]
MRLAPSTKMIGPILSMVGSSHCLAVVAVTLLLIYLLNRRPHNLPPSPGRAFPFIGHLYLLEKNPRKQFRQWAEKYGDVFTLQMGPQTTVLLSSFQAIQEAFVKKADFFSDRNENYFLAKFSKDFTKGVGLSSGPVWKAQRKTSLSILRNFGMGSSLLAEKIMQEVSCFIQELTSKNGQPSDIRSLTNMSVANVIGSIIVGHRFEFDDPKFIKMMEMFNVVVRTNSRVLVLNFFPYLFYLPFDIFKGKKLLNAISELQSFTFDMIRQIKEKCDPEKLDNYIVAYTDAMKKEQASGEITYLDDINVARNIDGLFIAGSETTSSTILWCLLYVLNYPEVQSKIFNEIQEQIGTERLPNMADKPKMKYLKAFIMEVQRVTSIVPLGLPHLCSKESTVAGYTIPKGTIVLPNLDAVHKSKEIWGDPETFRPERFLDEQGNIVKREELIPFSMGRRACLGESLAKMELFLFLCGLFQRFEFLPPSTNNVPPLTETFGGVAAPESFEIRCVDRLKQV